MIRGSRTAGALTFALLLTATATACSSKAGSSASTIKIALEAPLSGTQASNGIDQFNGAKLAVDQANAAGGVLGKKLELVRADDKADAATGLTVAAQMVADKVFAVVGPYNSSVGVKNIKTYLNAGVVVIHLTSNSSTNGEGYTIQPKDYQIAPVEAKAIEGFYKAKSVAIVYDPSTYTSGIAGQVKTALERAGVTVVTSAKVDPNAKSYAGLLSGIQKKKPDLLYVSTYYPEGGTIAKNLQAMRARPTCLMGLANQDAGFVQAAGLAAARLCDFSGVPSAENFPLATTYVSDYKTAYGTDPGTWGTFTFDSVNLLIDAVKRAGAWDAAKVRTALRDTKDFKGITGAMSIDPATGNRVDVPVAILTLSTDGKYTVNQKWAAFARFGR